LLNSKTEQFFDWLNYLFAAVTALILNCIFTVFILLLILHCLLICTLYIYLL